MGSVWRGIGYLAAFVVAAILTFCGIGTVETSLHRAGPEAGLIAAPIIGPVIATDGYQLVLTLVRPQCGDGSLTSITATTVTIQLQVDLIVSMCNINSPLPYTVSVMVPGGLGGRTVIDATTGHDVPVLDAAGAPHPATPLANTGNSVYATIAPGFGAPGATTLAEAFLVLPITGQNNTVLWIVQTTAPWVPPSAMVTKPVTVRGRPGRAGPGLVVWPENGFTDAVMWREPVGTPDPSTASIVALANTLVRT
jgi:hypothetical protein